MGSYETLFSVPVIAVVLEACLGSARGLTEDDLASSGVEEGQRQRALEALLGSGLLARSGNSYVINGEEDYREKARQLIGAFREIEGVTRASLTVRGILNATAYFRCLVHTGTLKDLCVGEGLSVAVIERAIALDEEQGYVEHLTITYRSRGGLRERFFPFVPYHHYEEFSDTKGRVLETFGHRKTQPEAGLALSEEDYLLGAYPETLAEQSRQYLGKEGPDLLAKVRNEAFDIIWYYDRY